MKKTLLALAVLAAAGSVNAAEVYNDGEGFAVEIGADVDVEYTKGQTEGSEAAIGIEDSDFDFAISAQVNDDVTAIGYIDFDGEDSDPSDSTVNLDDAYVGFESATKGTITIGKQATISDDAGIGSDKEFGLDKAVVASTSGDEVIKYQYSGDEFSFGLAFADDDASDTEESSNIDGMFGYAVDAFEGRIFAGQYENEGEKDTYVALELDFQATDTLFLQASYSSSSEETAGEPDDNTDAVGFAADFEATDDVTLSAGIATVSEEDEDDYTEGFINVDYAIATNTSLYAEYGFTNEEDADNGFALGMVVEF